MGFATCKEDAISLSEAIPGSGVAYGMYTPDTPRETWDEGWREGSPVSIHFWVEKENNIYDSAQEQFGGPPLVRTDYSDPRYVRVGRFIPSENRVIPEVEDPSINWDTFTKPGAPVLVNWNNPPAYVRKALGW